MVIDSVRSALSCGECLACVARSQHETGVQNRYVLVDPDQEARGSTVRLGAQAASGKYPASYMSPYGERVNAPMTFPNRVRADTWLSVLLREVW